MDPAMMPITMNHGSVSSQRSSSHPSSHPARMEPRKLLPSTHPSLIAPVTILWGVSLFGTDELRSPAYHVHRTTDHVVAAGCLQPHDLPISALVNRFTRHSTCAISEVFRSSHPLRVAVEKAGSRCLPGERADSLCPPRKRVQPSTPWCWWETPPGRQGEIRPHTCPGNPSGYAGKALASLRILPANSSRTGASWRWRSTSAISPAVSSASASFIPWVVMAGVPILIPLPTNGLRGSKGTVLKLQVMPTESSSLAACFPVNSSSMLRISARNMWLSVPPPTTRTPSAIERATIARALATIWLAYSRYSGVDASRKHTALAAT